MKTHCLLRDDLNRAHENIPSVFEILSSELLLNLLNLILIKYLLNHLSVGIINILHFVNIQRRLNRYIKEFEFQKPLESQFEAS